MHIAALAHRSETSHGSALSCVTALLMTRAVSSAFPFQPHRKNGWRRAELSAAGIEQE